MNQPQEGEYHPVFKKYIDQVPETDIIKLLTAQPSHDFVFLDTITEEQSYYRYAPEKWSFKQVVGHLIEVERIFAYRVLRISRQDKTPLPSFDENSFVAHSFYDERNYKDLLHELDAVRKANVFLFKNLTPEQLNYTGIASNASISVNALLFILAGHIRHHIMIIKERYLEHVV